MSDQPLTFRGCIVATFLTVIAVSIAFTAFMDWHQKQRNAGRRAAAHVDQIVKACKLYAMDYDGHYPRFDTAAAGGVWPLEDGVEFKTSTDAFKELIREVDLGTELIFYTRSKNPAKSRPNDDGVLTPTENCFSIISGLSDNSPSSWPLVADEMIDSSGSFGEYHPYLKS
ncbi:MAG: hypothetical protein AAF585_14670 [Verrucomicrobiota bacterium]